MKPGQTNLAEILLAQANERPDARAVVDDEGELTFSDLADLSARIRTGLIRGGVAPGDRVCLLTPKTGMAVAAILGVLRAGAVYVPIDPDSPGVRAARILRRSDTTWVLAAHSAADVLSEMARHAGPGLHVAWLTDGHAVDMDVETAWSREDLLSDGGTPDRLSGVDDPAYMMFTSGSTGEPKGVVITHANVLAFLDWAVPYFGIGSDDRLSAHPPLHFDLSVFDLFGALTAGAELHPVPARTNILPTQIVDFIEERELTQWFSVPGVLTLLSRYELLDRDRLASLRRVLWCGEVLPTPVLMDWMAAFPHVEFTNLYGPTEATIASSYFTVDTPPSDPTEPIPIGRACEGEELLILDEGMRAVPAGEMGDLWIGGAGVSPGYWRDPEKTAAAFVPDPRSGREGTLYRTGDVASQRPDGMFMFHGRRDRQIKSRGYRIELDEIEVAINALPEIRQAAVVAVATDGFENVRIACAYLADGSPPPGPAALKRALKDTLPSYMMPRLWELMERLPRNANGKVDHPAVRDMFSRAVAGDDGAGAGS